MDKLSFNVDELAAATGLGKTTIRDAIRDGNLLAAYSGSKPVVLREEAERWLRSLPTERRAS